jgi:hypothetical protein
MRKSREAAFRLPAFCFAEVIGALVLSRDFGASRIFDCRGAFAQNRRHFCARRSCELLVM